MLEARGELRKAKSFEWYDKNDGEQEKMRMAYRQLSNLNSLGHMGTPHFNTQIILIHNYFLILHEDKENATIYHDWKNH